MAYALQNNFSSPTAWTSRAARKKMIKMVCYRKMNAWIGRVHGDCNWNIVVGFAGGKQTVVGNFVHGHELDGMKPAESPMKSVCYYGDSRAVLIVWVLQEGKVGKINDSEIDWNGACSALARRQLERRVSQVLR